MQSIFQSNIRYYGNILFTHILLSTIMCSVEAHYHYLQTPMIEYC